jgi:hypothetical protein
MAIRRRQLKQRVADVGTNTAQAMGTYHPIGTEATPMVMPLALVQITRPAGTYGGGDYGAVTYQDATTMWGPNGEPIPATTPGGWGQLRAAGRP